MITRDTFHLTDEDRLREVVAKCCDGRATAEDWRELSESILKSKGNAGFYIASITTHSELGTLMADHGGSCPEVLTASKIGSILSERGKIPGTSQAGRRRLMWLSGGLVCLMLVVAAQGLWLGVGKTEVASIVDLNGSGQARSLQPGDRVKQDAGESIISFYNGVKVTFDGPVDLEILSGTKVLLRTGQVKADVGEHGRGFKILTDSAEVIDLGTVFGVEANPSVSTDVIVFDGLVEVDRRLENNETTRLMDRSLTTGEAIRVHRNGDLARIPALWREGEHWKWSTTSPEVTSSLIASVTDNLSTASQPKCYAVIAGGFRPGARCYVDRDYVWSPNGTFGFPRELMGGDYIQTFNDDKMQSDFELKLELSSKADVYLLYDTRIVPPSWLQKDFVQVNRRIIQWADVQRYSMSKHGEQSRQTEPTEYRFQIWKRRSHDPGVIRLGSATTDPAQAKNGISMYGVVVVPLSKASGLGN